MGINSMTGKLIATVHLICILACASLRTSLMVHSMCPLERESFKLAAFVSILVIDDVIFVRVTCAMDCLFRAMESMDVLVQEVSKRRGTAEVDNELKD